MKMAVFWVAVSIIALMMEAANTSETSVDVYKTTWRNSSNGAVIIDLKIGFTSRTVLS
jgi:hypothetical protein